MALFANLQGGTVIAFKFTEPTKGSSVYLYAHNRLEKTRASAKGIRSFTSSFCAAEIRHARGEYKWLNELILIITSGTNAFVGVIRVSRFSWLLPNLRSPHLLTLMTASPSTLESQPGVTWLCSLGVCSDFIDALARHPTAVVPIRQHHCEMRGGSWAAGLCALVQSLSHLGNSEY